MPKWSFIRIKYRCKIILVNLDGMKQGLFFFAQYDISGLKDKMFFI